MTDNEQFLKRFERVIDLDEKGEKILQSIRFQDEDQSTKGGAVLTYSGLLITTSLVQFSVSEQSIVFLDPGSLYFKFSVFGLLALLVSALLSLLNMVVTRRSYSTECYAALKEFEGLVKIRRYLLIFSVGFAALGTLLVLVALFRSIVT